MKPWLEELEVQELTKRIRPSAQEKQLESLGMSHLIKYRTDGSFIVLREGVSARADQPEKEYTLDFSSLGNRNGTQAA